MSDNTRTQFWYGALFVWEYGKILLRVLLVLTVLGVAGFGVYSLFSDDSNGEVTYHCDGSDTMGYPSPGTIESAACWLEGDVHFNSNTGNTMPFDMGDTWQFVTPERAEELRNGSSWAPDAEYRNWGQCIEYMGDTWYVVCPDGYVESS